MELRKASRKKAKIRLGLSAVSGAGKTYSALLIAYGICGDWSKIAVIDTENNSADLYAHLGEYNVLPLQAPFTPERYIEAIKACEKAKMEVIVVDSITHEWDGKGGCLEIVESLGGKYQDWAKVTPRHQNFIDAIIQSSAHVITTVRRKTDYEMVKDNNGKVKVEKGGLREVTREGFEYELTVNLEVDTTHHAKASKDRTGLFMGKPEFIPTEDTGRLIRDWCESGEAANIDEWRERLKSAVSIGELTAIYNEKKREVDANPIIQSMIGERKRAIIEHMNALKDEPKPVSTAQVTTPEPIAQPPVAITNPDEGF